MGTIWAEIIENYSFVIPIVCVVVCFLIRVPISITMFVSSTVYILAMGLNVSTLLSRFMVRFTENFVIIAVPLFIFTANILNSSKVSDYMFDFAKAAIGKRKGALAYVNVLISLIFAGMSGSAFADATGIGKIELDAQRKDGYPDDFTAALTACTATIGPVFPPSLNLVTFSMITGASCGALLLGGVLPAFLMAGAVMVYIALIAGKRDFPPGLDYSRKEFWSFTWKALPALMTPVILLTSIYTGIVTATEAAAISAGYAIIVALFIYKTIDLKGIWACFKSTAIQCGPTMLIIAASGPFNYCMTVSGLGEIVLDFFSRIASSPWVFLLIANILFLILGMFLDTSTITWVILPLIYPVAQTLGINMVHFGVIYVMNTLIGMCTPPFGMLVFLSSQLANAPVKRVFKEALPMVGFLLIVLFLVTYVPGLTLWLGNVVLSR